MSSRPVDPHARLGHAAAVALRLASSLPFLLIASFWSSAAVADCGYSRNVLAQYLAACSQQDGCRFAERMKALTAEACGESMSEPTRPAQTSVSPSPQPVQPADEPNAPVAAEQPPTRTSTETGLDPEEDHTGKPCRYFTGRSSVENEEGTLRLNYYEEGAKVCYGDRYYACTNGRWAVHQQWCPSGARRAEDVES